MKLRSIRAGRGLGDSLYLQGVVRHFVEKGERLEVCSDWPDIFRHYGDKVQVVPFRRINVNLCAHYSLRKQQPTNQWQDCCIQAGINESIDLRLDWTPGPSLLPPRSKPVLCVALPRQPMGRADGFGRELLPDCRVIQRCIDQLRERYLIVQIGAGEPLYRFRNIDVDLANQTTVAQLIDVASEADAFLGYCSWLVPLAEGFNKPALFVWSRKGLNARHPYVRQITPRKILSCSTSRFVIDDQSSDAIGAVAALL